MYLEVHIDLQRSHKVALAKSLSCAIKVLQRESVPAALTVAKHFRHAAS